MELRVLGSIEVRVDDESLDLGGLRQRRMLAALLASPNRTVPMTMLGLSDLWWYATRRCLSGWKIYGVAMTMPQG